MRERDGWVRERDGWVRGAMNEREGWVGEGEGYVFTDIVTYDDSNRAGTFAPYFRTC